MEYSSFDDILESADVILTGEIKNISSHPDYDEYDVQVSSVKKGNVGDSVDVRNYFFEYTYEYNNVQGEGRTSTEYEIGESYVFILQCIENVYEKRYVIISDAYIPISNDGVSTVLSNEIKGVGDPVSYINSYEFNNESGDGRNLSLDYIKSSDLKEIAEKSDYIVKVRLKELYHSTDVVDVYSCDVLQDLKGKIHMDGDSRIIIPFFKKTVKADEEYVVLLNTDSKDSNIYMLSSKNSVYDAADGEKFVSMLKGEKR